MTTPASLIPTHPVAHTEEAIRALSRVSLASGREFFDILVQEISQVIGSRHVLVCEIAEDQTMHIVSSSPAGLGLPDDFLQTPLPETALGTILSQGDLSLPSNAHLSFPQDSWFRHTQDTAVVGVALHDSLRKPIGLIAAFHHLPVPQGTDPLGTLRLLGSRASVELERYRTAAQLTRNETRMQSVFNSLAAGIIIYNLQGYAIRCNPSACTILHCSQQTILDTPLHHPDWHVTDTTGRRLEVGEFPASICLSQGIAIYDQIIGLHLPSRPPLWLSVSAQPVVYEGEDRHKIIVVSFYDVTGKRRAEEALRLSEERYRTLTEHSPDAITVIDAETLKYVDLNGRAESLFLMPRKELLESSPLDVSPTNQPDGASSAELLKFHIDNAVRGRNAHFEWLHRRKTGELILCDVRFARMPSPDRVLVRASATDITLQRRSQQRFQIIAEQTGQLLYEYDLHSGEISWSGAIQAVTGFTPEEFRRMNFDRWGEAIHPEDRPRAFESLERVIQHGGRYEVKYRFRCKNGSYVEIEDHGVVLRDEANEPTVMLGTMSDQTQRREQERIQRELEGQLRQSQKMEAVGTLAGGIAHDFNNLLGAIMGYTELAGMEATDRPEILKLLDEVLKASERARDLVRQILTFSRRQQPDLKPIDLATCAKDAASLLRATLPPSIQLKIRIEDTPRIRGDASQIEQVLINLCTNAAHAIGGQKGQISLSIRQVEVTSGLPTDGLPSLTPGPYAELSVQDTGCGMDEDTLKRIFEPFYTTKKLGEGTGLGLAVVHGIVTDHSGAIVAYSRPGHGSTFRVLFPITHEGEESQTEKLTAAQTPGRGQSILVVDDEADLARVIARILHRLGYHSMVETDPVAALEGLRSGRYSADLVIADLAMPGMTGIELAGAIHLWNPRIPVIMITGYGGDWTAEKAAEYGVRRIASKPISVTQLSTLVDEVLGGTSATQAPS